MTVRSQEFNAQEQRRIVWAPATVVALAYLDQLGRTGGITPARSAEIASVLERADGIRSARERDAAATAGRLEDLARQVRETADAAASPDASRLRPLAANLDARAKLLR
jgi:hypothetical protein